MFTSYIIVALLAIAMNGYIAVADFAHARFVLANMASLGIPKSWLSTLGSLKVAAVGGLVLGLIGVPLIGTAAAIGLVLFFIGAIITHLRARNYSLLFPGLFLGVAIATLGLDLAS